jgi:multicomponent Na+:H+ antiporter subunit D
MEIPVILMPLLVPLLGAVLCLFFWNFTQIQKWGFVGFMGLVLASAWMLLSEVMAKGILTTQIGNWQAPFGITIVADTLSCIMVLLTGIIGFAFAVYSIAHLDHKRKKFGFYPISLFLFFGINGSFLTGDIFNLYVWFEVMLMSTFVLLTLGGTKKQLEGSIKYVTMNFLASSVFLAGIAIVYGLVGSLNMAHLALLLPEHPQQGLVALSGVFFIVGFGIKAALFPMFFWLPASYHTPPIAITSMIAGLLTKVGVYAIMRFFTLIYVDESGYLHDILLYIAIFSMVTGVLGAVIQNEVRRILSFHIISQIGYMILGIALFTPLALAGAIFYIIHHILVKSNLFFISGIMHSLGGSFKLKELGGAYDKFPFIALLFAISAFSLVGVPPLSGFWGKYMIARAGMETAQYGVVVAILGVSILTLFSMTKIWAEAFWKTKPDQKPGGPAPAIPLKSRNWMVVAVSMLVICILAVGLYAQPVVDISFQAAEQLINKDIYIGKVLESLPIISK